MHERTIRLHLPRIRGSHTDTTSETEEGYRSKLHKKSKFRTDHEKNQLDLAYEIRNLDEVLDRHMHFLDGFLFSREVDQKLQQTLVEELRRHKGNFDLECFGSVLQNPQNQEEELSLYKKIRLLGKQNQVSYYENTSTISTPVARRRSAVRHEPSTIEKQSLPVGNVFNPKELERFLKKQPNTVTVWLPPASYPQFFCYVTFSRIYMSSSRQHVLRLDKFYLPRYHNPSKMFGSLFKFLQECIAKEIQHLQIRCSRASYHSRFKRWGWQLKSIKEDECRLWYSLDLN